MSKIRNIKELINKEVSCSNLAHLGKQNKFRDEKAELNLGDWLDLNTGSKEREKFASVAGWTNK